MSNKLVKTESSGPITCGLVMPISPIDSCSAEHWADVKTIISESVESIAEPKFAVKLVSDADDVGVIQKRIVQNVYMSDILVCDVSGRNPNVMFELGMRLAFDKPTIIVKDDKTDYSFDTSIIEHIPYPRDLRFSKIVKFKSQLAEKVSATYKKSKDDPEHSTFLKSFGKFHIASLEESVVSSDKVVIEMLEELQADVSAMKRRSSYGPIRRSDSVAEMSVIKIKSIVDAVSEYRTSHTSSEPTINLLGNPDFCDFIGRKVDAPSIFKSRDEFMSSLEYILQRYAC